MHVLKFSVFTNGEFINWQKESERKISQVFPILNGISGDVSIHGVDIDSKFSVFVLYWEED